MPALPPPPVEAPGEPAAGDEPPWPPADDDERPAVVGEVARRRAGAGRRAARRGRAGGGGAASPEPVSVLVPWSAGAGAAPVAGSPAAGAAELSEPTSAFWPQAARRSARVITSATGGNLRRTTCHSSPWWIGQVSPPGTRRARARLRPPSRRKTGDGQPTGPRTTPMRTARPATTGTSRAVGVEMWSQKPTVGSARGTGAWARAGAGIRSRRPRAGIRSRRPRARRAEETGPVSGARAQA